MILGLGSDLVDIRRIEDSLERFGDRFLTRIFTPEERAALADRQGKVLVSAYAKRFAAKEACAKALGTGFALGVSWQDIQVRNDANGMPLLVLSGGAAQRATDMTPKGMSTALHLSLSDEYPLAQAMVILSAVPKP